MIAYQLLLDKGKYKIDEDLRNGFRTSEAIMFWDVYEKKRMLKMMKLSLILNGHHLTTNLNNTFFVIAKQVRALWVEWGRPSERAAKGDENWRVSSYPPIS